MHQPEAQCLTPKLSMELNSQINGSYTRHVFPAECVGRTISETNPNRLSYLRQDYIHNRHNPRILNDPSSGTNTDN